MIGFILGIFAASRLSDTYILWGVLALGLCVVLVGALIHTGRTARKAHPLKANSVHLLCAVLGAVWFFIHADWGLSHRLTLNQVDVWAVSGVVDDLVLIKPDYQRFRLRVDSVSKTESTKIQAEPPNLRFITLNVYNTDHLYHAGDAIHVVAKLKPPHSYRNPKAFDLERHAFIRRVDATGYVKVLLDSEPASAVSINAIRSRVAEYLDRVLPAQASPQLAAKESLKALWIGDKRGISSDHWQVLQITGTAHLWVVSGLHIGLCVLAGLMAGRLIGGVVGLFLTRREGRSARISLLLGVITALVLSGVYVLLAGSSLPTQRAWLMAAVVLGSYLFQKEIALWQRWLVALTVVLAWDPLAIYETGLWLSFWAVGVLMLLGSRRKKEGKVRQAFRMQLWMGLLMMPLMLTLFDGVSWISPWVNLWAIPLMLILLVASVAAGLISLLGPLPPLEWVAWLLDQFWSLLVWHSNALPNGFLRWSLPEGSSLWLIALMLCLLMRHRLKWVLMMALLIPLVLPAKSYFSEGTFEARVYDVGQGSAVLIHTRDARLLYDSGAVYRSGITAFERAVLPLWQFQNIESLDKLIISHSDTDHIGGASFILDKTKVDSLDYGSPWTLPIDASIKRQSCHDAPAWDWNGVRFEYIRDPRQQSSEDTNQQSCILKVQGRECSLLLMGDADTEVEGWLMPKIGPVTWLMVGHHGSKTSTSSALLEAAQPQAAIISAGFLNRYRHPHPDVVERIRAYDIPIHRTDQAGMITLKSDSQGCRLDTRQQSQKRLWSKG
jgi:competence protein ComEC